MTPLSLLAAQTLLAKLTTGASPGDDLTGLISAANTALTTSVPPIPVSEIVLSSAAPDLADRNVQLTYPRINIYTSGLKNTQVEKFRAFSGTLTVVAEIWSSGDFVSQSDTWIHVYTECCSELLQKSVGDWGNGLFYSGAYDVQFTAPRPGGLGFVQSARLTVSLGVSAG
jgi:hypothetical protein